MSKIKVQMENCYGIGKLEHEFEFTSDCPYSVVYAPNGTMKTFPRPVNGLPRPVAHFTRLRGAGFCK